MHENRPRVGVSFVRTWKDTVAAAIWHRDRDLVCSSDSSGGISTVDKRQPPAAVVKHATSESEGTANHSIHIVSSNSSSSGSTTSTNAGGGSEPQLTAPRLGPISHSAALRSSASSSPQHPPAPHSPIKVGGYYSDELFAPWLFATVGWQSWCTTDNVDRVSNITADEFRTRSATTPLSLPFPFSFSFSLASSLSPACPVCVNGFGTQRIFYL
jgi:hypothetical protein